MKEQTEFIQTTYNTKTFQSSKPSFKEEILSYKEVIQNIKNNHKEKLVAAKTQLDSEQLQYKEPSSSTKKNVARQIVEGQCTVKVQIKDQDQKNKNVSDTDKMLYEKKFKNFLNHRQKFQALAKQRRQKIMEDRKTKQKGQIDIEYDYEGQQDILKEGNGQNLFQNAEEMVGLYEEITFGKKNKKTNTKLFHGQKVEENFRKSQFEYLLLIESQLSQSEGYNQKQQPLNTVNKDIFIEYLFNEPAVMMLYSINPYQLGDELAEFQTLTPGFMTFGEFSQFLLIDREPTYFQYSKENLQEARKNGRGIKCQPIISKWIGDPQIYDWLLQNFQALDILGQRLVDRQVLVRKFRKECQKKRLLNEEIIQIVNINKLVTIDRILYEIEHTTQMTEKISEQQFVNLLNHYHRLQTPQKDKLITKLILNGKYDPSYVFILGNQPLQVIKESFNSMQKYAEYFVTKEKYVQKLTKNKIFTKIKSLPVRSQSNRYVKMETIETTLVRFLNEADNYVDLQEILDFFTNRGRPRKIEHQIYLANLERQLKNIEEQEQRKQQKKLSQGDFSTSSDEQEFQRTLKQKKIQRKKEKLASIRAAENFSVGKKFNVTVPSTFSFGDGVKQKTKVSIREKKLRQQLQEKRRAEDEAMIPFKPKPVPQHVRQDLYQKLLRQQQRQRRQRLQRFRLQIQNSMVSISPHLLSKPKSKSIYEIKPKQSKFVAKPLPWYCEVNLLERIQKEKDQRRERILEQVIDKHNDSDIPEGFKKMIERGQKTLEDKSRARTLSKTTANDKQCTFNPKITQGIPDFKMIHEHLEIDLLNKKQQKKPIKVQPFSFQNRPSRSRTAVEPQHHQFHHKSKHVEQKRQEHEINIPITQKHLAFVNLRKKQQNEKIQKEDEQKRAETLRKMRQQKFAPYVRQVLKRSRVGDASQSKALIESKIREFKKQERKRKRQYEEEMIKIYTKVFNRPLLVEGQGEQKIDNYNSRQQQIQRSKSNKRAQRGKDQQRQEVEHFAQDYKIHQQRNEQPKRNVKQDQYEDLRRKAIEHPPRNYLMEEPNGDDGQNDQQPTDQQYDYDEEYLSENGRYTN